MWWTHCCPRSHLLYIPNYPNRVGSLELTILFVVFRAHLRALSVHDLCWVLNLKLIKLHAIVKHNNLAWHFRPVPGKYCTDRDTGILKGTGELISFPWLIFSFHWKLLKHITLLFVGCIDCSSLYITTAVSTSQLHFRSILQAIEYDG